MGIIVQLSSFDLPRFLYSIQKLRPEVFVENPDVTQLINIIVLGSI